MVNHENQAVMRVTASKSPEGPSGSLVESGLELSSKK